ncbi:MAG: hypothetical protein V4568_11640, partial [Pseudomonadota bacterium]
MMSGDSTKLSNQKILDDAFHAYCHDSALVGNKSRKKERRRIRDAILSWSSKNDSSLTLTFNGCKSEELALLPSEVITHFAERVQHLVLPRSLNNTGKLPPSWLKSLTEIKEISFPDYQDEVLELREIYPKDGCKLLVQGGNIRTVHGSDRVHIYSPDVPSEADVRAYYYSKDTAKVECEQALGYVREVIPLQKEEYRYLNNNAQAEFPDGTAVTCGNIAAHTIMSQQAYRSEYSSPIWISMLSGQQKGIFSRKKKRAERLHEELETIKKKVLHQFHCDFVRDLAR